MRLVIISAFFMIFKKRGQPDPPYKGRPYRNHTLRIAAECGGMARRTRIESIKDVTKAK